MTDNSMLQWARLQREVLSYDPQAFSLDDQDASSRPEQQDPNNPPQTLGPSHYCTWDIALWFLSVSGQSRFAKLVSVPGSNFYH